MSPETTIGVVGCNPVWWSVSVKVDVKANYGLRTTPRQIKRGYNPWLGSPS